MARRGLGFALVAVVLSGYASAAWAGGFEIPDNGSRAMGRGGAYASAVAEPSALYYNPAALSLIDGFAATVNANLWFYQSTFQRDPFTTTILRQDRTYTFEESENLDPFFPAPMLFLSYDFGLEDWGFGLGVYGPSAIGHRRYGSPNLEELSEITNEDEAPRTWGHGYMVEETDIFLVFFAVAAAYDFGPLQVGLTLQLGWMSTEFMTASDGGGNFDPMEDSREEPSLYAPAAITVDGFAPSGILAVRYQPLTPLTLSLSYRPRIPIEAEGTFEATLPVRLEDQVVFEGNSASMSLTMPDVVRFGANWAFISEGQQLADIELDVVFEGWSITDEFAATIDSEVLIDLTGDQRSVPERIIPKGLANTLSVRLGGDVRVTDWLTVRAGGYIEGSADGDFFTQGSTSPGYANLDFTPFSRYAVTVGASWELFDFSLDVGLMHVFSPTWEEHDGQVDLFYPLWVCNEPQTASDQQACSERTTSATHAVNNGIYDVSYDLISVGLTYHYE